MVTQYNDLIDNKEKLPFLEMLKNIAAHQDTYELFFYFHLDRKLSENLDFSHYFVYPSDANACDKIFVQAAVNAVIKYWLKNQCQESPEEINELIIDKIKCLGLLNNQQ